jgi:aminoglycoside phosphotransferase (APT) family kinase protein
MHADEVDFDASLVQQLVAERFPELAELPLREVEPAGTDNRLFRIGEELVARIPVVERSGETLRREVRWLPVLAPALPVRIPEPVALVEPDGFPFPWAVYRWLDGEPADGCTAEELASFLGALRRLDPAMGPQPSAQNSGRGVPLAHRDSPAMRDAVATIGALDVWESALAAPAWDGPPVWIHGDLDARNLLVRDGRLDAVLDWGCVGVGDPACDIGAAWKLLDAHERVAFRELLEVDDATWLRARGWLVSQAAMIVTYYTVETNATLLREGERWLAAL